MTAFRRIAQALAIPVALFAAVVLQLAVVNRAPLPLGAAPDLVLLTVAALAVCTGPMTGMLAGFFGGLALDIAPPAAHLAGEYALVFCLVGYACGRVRNAIIWSTGEQTMVVSLTIMGLGVAAGEAGKAALGLMLSDPNVTSPAIKHVLPVAIIYDLLLCPFVYWLISLMLRRPAPERAPRPEFAQVANAFRVASSGALGAVPTLRLAGSTPLPARPPARQEPKLRLGGSRSPALSGTSAASSTAQSPLVSGRAVKLNFAQHTSGTAATRPRERRSPGKGWLRAQPPTGAPVLKQKPPPKGWLRPARSAGTPAVRSGSPSKGWLHAQKPAGTSALSRRTPRKGWLRPAKPVTQARRKKPGRGWLRPAKQPKLSWYAKEPSSQWVRHSHSPWRNRRRRLLALVGVRR
jgi:rod shape-determining protein MreD